MSYKKIYSFCVDKDEKFLFAANISGQILKLDPLTFAQDQIVEAHCGTITVMVAHPKLPLIASLGKDRFVNVYQYDQAGTLSLVFRNSVRDYRAATESVHLRAVHSTSQGLAFHPTEAQLAVRSGNAAIVEMSIQSNQPEVLRVFRGDETQDVATLKYDRDGRHLFAGTTSGRLYRYCDGKVVGMWEFGTESIHWVEHLKDETYLLASDARKVIRMDFSQEPAVVTVGESFARDDFEHVTVCPTSGRCFGASFDRNLYEIDTETLLPKKVFFKAPFKLRWVKVLRSESLILQCRNGALYRLDMKSAEVLQTLKETPDALWTSAPDADGTVFLAGEGNYYYRARARNALTSSLRKSTWDLEKFALSTQDDAYTKRMDHSTARKLLAFGRSSGDVILVNSSQEEQFKINVGSAVRDLSFSQDGDRLFLVTEAGHALLVDTATGEVLKKFQAQLPLWALALNEKEGLLAVSERIGKIFFLDLLTLEIKFVLEHGGYSKRMKWLGAKLVYNSRSHLRVFDLKTQDDREFSFNFGNSVEDFIVDPSGSYLLAISYSRNITLVDFQTGEFLWRMSDQMDYSKGLFWLPTIAQASGYPLEFFTFGRTGALHGFQIYEERLIGTGVASTIGK